MLTDAAIRRIKPEAKPYKVADMHRLYLLVLTSGGRYWRMDYRHEGKRGTTALGVYPQVSLKEAREKRASAQRLLDKGINPSSYKKLTRGVASISGAVTFKAVAQEWLQKIEAEGRAPKTMEKVRWLLDFAYPLIGDRPVSDISAPELLTVLRTLEVKGATNRRADCAAPAGAYFGTRLPRAGRSGTYRQICTARSSPPRSSIARRSWSHASSALCCGQSRPTKGSRT
jgi:hypothetical protein